MSMRASRLVRLAAVATLSLCVSGLAAAQCPGPGGNSTPPGPSGGGGSSGPGTNSGGAPLSGGQGNVPGDSANGPRSGVQGAAKGKATGPVSGTQGGPGRAVRPATSGGQRGSSGRASRSGQRFVTSGTFAEPWWAWWEMNRLQYLRPRKTLGQQARADVPSSRYSFGSRLEGSFVARTLDEVLPLVEEATHDDDARVRARAAMTWGRLAGRQAIPRLTEMLDDRVVHVRHCALLGLGATGEIDATRELLALVDDPKSARDVSAHASSVAMMSLAIGRHYGMPDLVERYVDDVLETVDRKDDDRLASAAFVYDALSPSDRLRRHALAVAGDDRFDVIARCNALMSLGKSADVTATSTLVEALDDRDVDVRRAAAIGLTRHGDRPLVADLTAALAEENDAVARGHLVIALAEQHDGMAREALVSMLDANADATLRPWAVLGLGLRARRVGDVDETVELIHAAYAEESNHDAHGAYLLACGLARDRASVEWLRDELTSSADARQRVFAAQALALIGDTPSRDALREQISRETWPYARATLAQSLGYVGKGDDADTVIQVLRTLDDPTLQTAAGSAIGFFGTEEAVRGLVAVLADDEVPDVARGAALDGLGLMLSDERGLLLADLAAAANYTSFPSWVATLMGDVTL